MSQAILRRSSVFTDSTGKERNIYEKGKKITANFLTEECGFNFCRYKNLIHPVVQVDLWPFLVGLWQSFLRFHVTDLRNFEMKDSRVVRQSDHSARLPNDDCTLKYATALEANFNKLFASFDS